MAVSVNQSKSVRVAQDGTGNFTTVGEAIAFAPNDTTVEEGGYFAIYVGEGVYQENVIVPKNKKNLILIGEGTDRTVITSNRNAADGWTTFNTATFGEQSMSIHQLSSHSIRSWFEDEKSSRDQNVGERLVQRCMGIGSSPRT